MNQLSASLPTAIAPEYHTASPNECIQLYDGDICTDSQGNKISANGVVHFRWMPFPSLELEITTEDINWQFVSYIDTVSIELVDIQMCTEATYIRSHISSAGPSTFTFLLVAQPYSSGTDCTQVLFHVANMSYYIGKAIEYEPGKAAPTRLEFLADEWHITLDHVDTQDSQLFKDLSKGGGYAITHVGKIALEDGAPFSPLEAVKVLESFRWFLCFSQGRFVGFPFILGYDNLGNLNYKQWTNSKITAGISKFSWFPTTNAIQTESLFQQFYNLWKDDLWKDTLISSIHWYVASNLNTVALEGSIVLSQIALERLAWMVLVVERNAISRDGFENLHASDEFNLLLNQLGIPKHIPPSLKQLAAYCKRIPANSLSECITIFRNRIVHPPKKNRTSPGAEVLIEAWKASLWALELTILSLLGYQGCYVNRIDPEAKWVGQTELVPWAPASDVEVS